ncbi:3-phosphoserine/phosphohydroxythreonine transaminase [Novilysobacter antarcticus]|uniref:3-phosphoserine/phosphohydroxythreonine transaminase n=1 Tax=Novilysobacter antarcticus TaxID=2862543 RepID=UPI001C992D9E|nr:3-phosphoserine/phosphohydroxythreonine transaminase [Lysobacter antarcticus]
MSRPYNFSAGPAALPEAVLEQAGEELLDWNGAGASVLELSHRGPEFMRAAEKAEADLRTLLSVPDDYAVLFLQGGATTQQALIPLNFAAPRQAADYILTGHWGATAIKQAQPYVDARVAADTADGGYRDLPARADWALSEGAAYVHYTANETIHGVEFDGIPDVGDVPLIGDFSSSIASGPLDISRFGVIYAGAQKNLGPVGLTVVIVRRDLLARTGQARAPILDYSAHERAGSMLNTPPTFNWYLAGLMFQWMLDEGGVEEFARRSAVKSQLLYAAIDGSDGFYRNTVERSARSRMNVVFSLHDEKLDARFLEQARAAGLISLKGHRVLGGMRASIYNAMPVSGAQALADFMADFQKRNG